VSADARERTGPVYLQRPGGFDILPAADGPAVPVAEGIWLSEGLSNSFLIATSEGRVVINTGIGFEAPVHKAKYDAIDASPVRYILLTQGHVDHVGGADLFREESTEIVAQANNREHQAYDGKMQTFRAARSSFAFRKVIEDMLRSGRDLGAPVQSVPTPTITFEDRYEFELGEVRFELLSVAGGETRDSMAVWLPDRKICFCGNLFSALFGHFPNLVTIRGDRYRDPVEFVESLDRVSALQPEILAVGHHEPVVGRALIRRELDRLREAVMYVHDETVRGMNEGKTVWQLMEEVRLPGRIAVGEGYGKVSWSVRAIWEQYAGWFKHRSTTELYGREPGASYADFVELAGGPDPIAERAQKKVDDGDPVAAVELAEAALSVDASHEVALRASLEAHELLERESENFWLSSWLRERIREIRAALGED
jgi:alkyl sulfatase BDS1-like metallo-beta-lactamase superfamily hydrolase